MKKIFFVAVMISALFLAACGGGSSSNGVGKRTGSETPTQVAETVLNGLRSGEDAQYAALQADYCEGLTDELVSQHKGQAMFASGTYIKTVGEEIAADGNTAVVKYKILLDNYPESDKDIIMKLDLVKTDAGWKVKMD